MPTDVIQNQVLAATWLYSLVSYAHHFAISLFLPVLYQWTLNLHITSNKVSVQLLCMPEMSWAGASFPLISSEIDKTSVTVVQEDTYSGGRPIVTSEVSITVENDQYHIQWCTWGKLLLLWLSWFVESLFFIINSITETGLTIISPIISSIYIEIYIRSHSRYSVSLFPLTLIYIVYICARPQVDKHPINY